MKRVWQLPATTLVGLFATAMCAMPQGTISARPGVVNYVEGHVFVDGRELKSSNLRNVTLSANQTLSTDVGKAEVLLTPGVFLRIGENSAVRMVSPSLVDTQVEVVKGEAMIEAAQVVKDSEVRAIDHGTVITIEKAGLYRVTADNPPTVAVFEGKADVQVGDRKEQVKKNKELVLAADAKAEKFNRKKEDELYAWSNVRSEYEAAASYASARTAAEAGNVNGSVALASGFAGFSGPGWYYNSPWNAWAWLPGNGYAFSPFGYGFYSPGYVGYAPVVMGGVYPGYYYGRNNGKWNNNQNGKQQVNGAPVPVNPNNPPAQGMAYRSPAAMSAARSQAMRSGVGTRAMMAAPQGGGHISAMGAGRMNGSAGHVSTMSAAHSAGMGGGGHVGGAGMGAGGGHAGGGGGRGR